MNIYNCSLQDLENYFIKKNEKKFKARQVFDWLYKKIVTSFEQMTNIKKELIFDLQQDFNMDHLKLIERQSDKDVYKYLFELPDKNTIEAVLMHHNYGYSL